MKLTDRSIAIGIRDDVASFPSMPCRHSPLRRGGNMHSSLSS